MVKALLPDGAVITLSLEECLTPLSGLSRDPQTMALQAQVTSLISFRTFAQCAPEDRLGFMAGHCSRAALAEAAVLRSRRHLAIQKIMSGAGGKSGRGDGSGGGVSVGGLGLGGTGLAVVGVGGLLAGHCSSVGAAEGSTGTLPLGVSCYVSDSVVDSVGGQMLVDSGIASSSRSDRGDDRGGHGGGSRLFSKSAESLQLLEVLSDTNRGRGGRGGRGGRAHGPGYVVGGRLVGGQRGAGGGGGAGRDVRFQEMMVDAMRASIRAISSNETLLRRQQPQ